LESVTLFVFVETSSSASRKGTSKRWFITSIGY
jgi:hypothetical protein